MHGVFGRVVTAAWGQAFLDPTLDRCHERNFLCAIGDAGGTDASTLDAAAERLMGGAGLLHRRITVEEPAGEHLHAGLLTCGYEAARHVFLAFAPEAEPPKPVPGVAVVEVDAEAVRPANEHYLLTDDATAAYGRDDRTRAQLLDHHVGYAAAGPATERIFAVRDGDDAVVAWARLWTADGVAQIEDVVCLAEHRGHGYGRAVVTAATRAALADGPDLTFIVADDDDWPKHLYARLGFTPIGHLGVYLRLVAARG